VDYYKLFIDHFFDLLLPSFVWLLLLNHGLNRPRDSSKVVHCYDDLNWLTLKEERGMKPRVWKIHYRVEIEGMIAKTRSVL
jgi:hypothetical protein